MPISAAPAPNAVMNDPRWEAVCARDRAFDGQFYYSVATTGVYCRPSCAARTPNPVNVAFHATPADAERAGFRACKRCRPAGPSLDEQHAQTITAACRRIEAAERAPSLSQLAEAAGLSASRFHRVFKAITGVTPLQYASACRARRLAQALPNSGSVTDARIEAGFGSSGRLYEQSAGLLGMTPSAWRAGGRGRTARFAVAPCSLGAVLVAQSEVGVCAILLGEQAEALVAELRRALPHAELVPGDADFAATVSAVVALVEDPRRGLDLPLDVAGTAFQRRVWEALRQIPAGETTSYAAIAAAIGAPTAARAVAGACAANRLAVVIPCHRVVRAGGDLSGYRWGVARKRALLAREREAG